MAVRVAQQLRLGDGELHLVRPGCRSPPGCRNSRASSSLPCFAIALGGAHARRQRVVAVLDLLVPLDRLRPVLLLLGDLAEADSARRPDRGSCMPSTRFSVLLGDRVVLELEGEHADGVDDLGIARVRREHGLELLARLRIALVEHQRARVVEARLATISDSWRRTSPRRFAAAVGRLLLQDLRLEQHRRFPIGAQLLRAPRRATRGVVVAGGARRLRDREVRLRQLRIASPRACAPRAALAALSGLPDEQAVQLQEAVLEVDALGGEQLLEVGLGLVDALRADQQRRGDLQRLRRGRLDVVPGLAPPRSRGRRGCAWLATSTARRATRGSRVRLARSR